MIVPSVDISKGNAVQLIGGKELAIDAGAPLPILQKFGKVGEVAVIDLDAAMSTGCNRQQIQTLLNHAKCRVGGGIRDIESAISWLDAGAAKVILGTAAKPEILQQLPRDRVIAALDALHDEQGNCEIVDQGWQNRTGRSVLERISELRDFVGGFLITFVEREGRLTGIDRSTVQKYTAAAEGVPITIAGGVASAGQIAELDALGVDAQVGMAIYNGSISLAEAFCAPLKSDRTDGLWPTIVANQSGQALGLAYSNTESVNASIETGYAHFWSRKRGLWKKGETSGNTQQLVAIETDCDRDCIRFLVEQQGIGFCHLAQATCFGDEIGLSKLQSRLKERANKSTEDSYVRKLYNNSKLLHAKLMEEAAELTEATTREEVIHEATDVLFFTFVKMIQAGISIADIEHELLRRSRKITRRGGQAKEMPPRTSECRTDNVASTDSIGGPQL